MRETVMRTPCHSTPGCGILMHRPPGVARQSWACDHSFHELSRCLVPGAELAKEGQLPSASAGALALRATVLWERDSQRAWCRLLLPARKGLSQSSASELLRASAGLAPALVGRLGGTEQCVPWENGTLAPPPTLFDLDLSQGPSRFRVAASPALLLRCWSFMWNLT